MKLRFVQWNNSIYIVLGIGYDALYDPADIYYCVPLNSTIVKDVIMSDLVKIPMSQAIEITDQNKIKALYILYK